MKINITCKYYSKKCEIEIEEKNPLKQGLKPTVLGGVRTFLVIEEKNPLKQGLKHSETITVHAVQDIEEKNPLKQGLKLGK